MSTAATAPMTAVLAEPVKAVTITVRNTCDCRFCTYCVMGFTGDACICGSDGIPQIECHGCTEDAVEYVGVVASQWFAANPSSSGTYVLSEQSAVLSEGSPLVTALEVSGRWEQRWTIEPWAGGVMRVSIYRDGLRVGEPVTVNS